ncbi:MAG: bifunctional diguanylate cyclase/phosphodiesterase [Aquisalimonadaceae bacterium]
MPDAGKTITQIRWRGTAKDAGTGEPAGKSDKAAPLRVLLLVQSFGNREQLAAHLRQHYKLMEPRGITLPHEPFDLAVVDGPGFRQWHTQLADAKARESPTFLPVMLVLPRRDLGRRLSEYWDLVDEFVISPINRSEFAERAAMLLRARQLAVIQQSHLAYLVNHDRATGLPNKSLFMDRLTNAVRDAAVIDKRLHAIVVHIPLVRVMKSMGHHGLERAASTCSSRLRALLEEDLSLARLTTEEWGLITRAGTSMDAVLEICQRVRRLAEAPIEILGERIHLSPRIGIGIYPDDASDATAVLDCAISALSQATDGDPEFYSRNVQHQALRYIRTEARLHEALAGDQFELWFQPQVQLDDQALVGVEALIRWRLPSGDVVPPGDFLAVAESTGLICDVDRWVLESACAAMHRWRQPGRRPLKMSVNISAQDVQLPGFAGMVEQTLDRHDIPPHLLELELTETSLFDMNADNLATLGELRAHGVSVAIDDFGTGYSSLSYLHRLPITTLKIDKAFVDDVADNRTNNAITRTIIRLAQNFELNIIAEGIETAKQARYLQTLEVPVGQGFLYGRPMPEADLLRWIERRVPDPKARRTQDQHDSRETKGRGQN